MADAAVFDVAELRTLILSFIDDAKDVRRLERVSKGFLHSLSDSYWSKVTKLTVSVVAWTSGPLYQLNDGACFTFEAVMTEIEWLLKRAVRLDRVQLSCSLHVPKAQQQVDAILAVVAENASSLKHLALSHRFLNPNRHLYAIVLWNAATLQHIDFEGDNYNHNQPPIPPSFMLCHAIVQCSSLRHVRLAALHGGYPLLEALRTLPNLDSVEVQLKDNTPQQVLFCLDGLAIRSLAVVGPQRPARDLTPALSVGPCRQLAQLHRLRLVDFDNCMMPTTLLSHCPQLSWLRVEFDLHHYAPQPLELCQYMFNWLHDNSTGDGRPPLLRVEIGAHGYPAPRWRTVLFHVEKMNETVLRLRRRLRQNATARVDPCGRLATFYYNDHTLELACDK